VKCSDSFSNGDFESFFSVNTKNLVKNLLDGLVVAQRQLYDAIHAAGGITRLKTEK